ncbi:MAG: hypothetical protein FJ302_06915 [Planctomycetes bacterium]|nr:hypothetical protein [Planctomycetota bacterium]
MVSIRSEQDFQEHSFSQEVSVCGLHEEQQTEPQSIAAWPLILERRSADLAIRQSLVRRMIYDCRLSRPLVDRLWNDLDSFAQRGRVLSDRARAQVTAIRLDDGEIQHSSHLPPGPHARRLSQPAIDEGVLKRFRLCGWWHTSGHMFLPTRAQNCWGYGRKLLKVGLLTPRPLAMIEERAGPLRFCSSVLTEFVPGINLDRFVQQTEPSTQELSRLAEDFAEMWFKFGQLRLSHGDFYPGNLLVTPDGRLQLIDLDRMNQHWFRHRHLRQREKDWKCFQERSQQVPALWAAFHAAVLRRESQAVGNEQGV